MGLLTNLWIKAKSVVGRRALSRSDLFSFCEPLLKQPAVPPVLLQRMQETFVRYSGELISLVEFYRRFHLTPALDKIANEATWHRQRATCLREILDEAHWSNWQYAMKHTESDWGKEIILGKLRALWPNATIEELKGYLLQFYLVTICTNAVLATVAQAFYGVGKTKQLEIELYTQYGREIDLLDTSIMDFAFRHHADDLDAANNIATWKDQKLNPVLEKMYRHLTSTKDQIIEDTFAIENFKRISDQLDGQKAALTQDLLSAYSS
jgi:hypothetical protein